VTGATGGKRAGSRRGPRRQRSFRPVLLLLALGITACVVAWGYLVYAAIDFGSTARGGDSRAWAFLAVASVGAVACLFFGLMLVAQLTRRLGITSPPATKGSSADGPPEDEPPRPIGGRRAAR
jgi:TRAP-type C4-dicarboxylate transport system permease small subunit